VDRCLSCTHFMCYYTALRMLHTPSVHAQCTCCHTLKVVGLLYWNEQRCPTDPDWGQPPQLAPEYARHQVRTLDAWVGAIRLAPVQLRVRHGRWWPATLRVLEHELEPTPRGHHDGVEPAQPQGLGVLLVPTAAAAAAASTGSSQTAGNLSACASQTYSAGPWRRLGCRTREW
jgi:hypothetical protein